LLVRLQRLDAPDIDADGAVELERAPAGRRFGIAEHDTDLLAQLVDEDHRTLRARDRAGQLAQRLRHQARLQSGQRIAHLALDLGARHERGHAIDDNDIDRVAAYERLRDLERLLAGVGLRDEQLIDLDTAGRRVGRLQCVLDVDVRGHATRGLRLCDDVLRQRRLARLRPKDLVMRPRGTADA
jgi:hypothetical protein